MRRTVVVFAAIALVAAAGVLARSLTPPDPLLQAVADGCERNDTTLHTLQSPNWVRVNDKDFPASGGQPPLQSVSGVVQNAVGDVHVSGGDNPVSHVAYDLNFDVNVSPESKDLVARTNTSGGIHVEREAQATPTFVWPEPGDRVTVVGYWVWDCDHYITNGAETGEETEIHPVTALWVERARSPSSRTGEKESDLFVTTDKTEAGKHSDCAHRTKHDQSAFKACVFAEPDYVDMSGTYKFAFKLPPNGRGKQVVRIVDVGSVNAPPIRIARSGNGIAIAFTIPADGKRHVVAKKVFAGWTLLKASTTHLRVSFDSVLIRRSMDPGCIPNALPGCGTPETTRDDQVTRGPTGEWVFYSDVAGVWSLWKKPLVWNVRDGQTIHPRASFDVYAPNGRPVRVFVWPHECDWASLARGGGDPLYPCPKQSEVGNRDGDDVPGAVAVQFRSPVAALGTHTVNSSNAGSTCPPSNAHGCYRVTLTVRRLR
jgi:hypothetical protein